MDLRVEHVGKRYARTGWALRDFQLHPGEGVLGLLGLNGAGKSTLMRIVATITQPSEGKVLWNGTDIACQPDALRSVLGYLLQEFGVYPHLSALEFLHYLAALKGLNRRTAHRRIGALLEVVNLVDARNRPLADFSGGIKQRVGIAQALLNDPRVLIVDEPTAGLDPEERVRFRTLLSDLASDRVVIHSTHIVSDVEATATAIALIHRGQLVLHAPPSRCCCASTDGCGSGSCRAPTCRCCDSACSSPPRCGATTVCMCAWSAVGVRGRAPRRSRRRWKKRISTSSLT